MAKRGGRALPDPRHFPDELSQVLAVLLRLSETSADPWLSTSAIQAELLDGFDINIHVRRVFGILSDNQGVAARRKRAGHWEFRILDSGKRALRAPPKAAVIVDPGHPIPAIIQLHGFLERLHGTVRVCDPYLDPVTMSHLDACGGGVKVMLLTEHIRGDVTVRAAVRQFARNQRSLEIRCSSSGRLHDRYIVDDQSVFYLGTSLNGFGKTQSAIIPLGVDVRSALLKQFGEEWASSRPWQ